MQSSFLRAVARAASAFIALAYFTPLHAASYTVLHSFDGNHDGAQAYGSLIQAADGNFYGTTGGGGAGSCNCGTIFKVTPGGAFTLLHTFGGADGASPRGSLLQAKDGNLYGTTYQGGDNDTGAVFKITTGGAFTKLHSFAAMPSGVYQNADGANPVGGLIQAADGNFYGTTQGGGLGDGTIFKMTSDGTLTDIHNMLYNEGGLPRSLVIGPDGDFYGSAIFYGQNADVPGGGYGTVFKISSSGYAFTLLHVFNKTDGEQPNRLIFGSDGSLYGTTAYGGAQKSGTVFKMTTAGAHTLLHSFVASPDGTLPQDALVQGLDGNLYGTTTFGGANGGGILFKITSAGALTIVHDFGGKDDGYWPFATITRGVDGNFYGTTQWGGDSGQGVIFMMPGPSSPPTWISPPTPNNNATFNLTATQPFDIALRAGDLDPASTVHIVATSKPSGSTVTAFDGNPANATFGWTPSQAGDFTATFKAGVIGAPLLASTLRTIKLHVVRRATSIVAQPAIVEVDTAEVHLHAIANLYANDPSAPLAGKLVRFTTTTGKLICASTTDTTGRAACTGVSALIATVASRGYIATFAGDSAYQGSSQYGYLVY